jgi:hypothetical protein
MILDAAVVEQINKDPASPWLAEMSPRFADVSLGEARRVMGALYPPTNIQYHIFTISITMDTLCLSCMHDGAGA